MGRIEYEYPLFKVYYSNNSNNSNIRGNPDPQNDEKSPTSRVDSAMAILREKSQGVARVPCVEGVGRKESLNKRTCLVPFSTIKKHCKLCCIHKSLIEVTVNSDSRSRSVIFKCHKFQSNVNQQTDSKKEYSDDYYYAGVRLLKVYKFFPKKTKIRLLFEAIADL